LLNRLVPGLALGLLAQRFELTVGLGFERRTRAASDALTHLVQLRGQAFLLAFDIGELVLDHGNLALQQADPLAVLTGELLGDSAGLRITDLAGELPAPLGIRELLAFARELALGGGECITILTRGDLELHQSIVQSRGLVPAIRQCGEQAIETGAQFVETHRSNVTAVMYLWESMLPRRLVCWFTLVVLAGCSGKAGNYGCGFAAVAGQSMLLDQFTRPGTVVGSLPTDIPEALPVRIALGPAFTSIVGKADTMLVVGVQGTLPATPLVGFGVLVLNPQDKVLGVLLYEGQVIKEAPLLGSVNAGGRDVPLIGIRLDLAQFEKPSCPIFPDSLRK